MELQELWSNWLTVSLLFLLLVGGAYVGWVITCICGMMDYYIKVVLPKLQNVEIEK